MWLLRKPCNQILAAIVHKLRKPSYVMKCFIKLSLSIKWRQYFLDWLPPSSWRMHWEGCILEINWQRKWKCQHISNRIMKHISRVLKAHVMIHSIHLLPVKLRHAFSILEPRNMLLFRSRCARTSYQRASIKYPTRQLLPTKQFYIPYILLLKETFSFLFYCFPFPLILIQKGEENNE